MKLLLAEDDRLCSRLVQRLLEPDYELVIAGDGTAAWNALSGDDPPRIVALNWVMPGLDGFEICRRIRQVPALEGTYILLITANDAVEDVVRGLSAGADDYIVKPFHATEIRARVRVGERVVRLQSALADRVRELEQALHHVQALQRLLPICSYCKRVRDDQNYWQELDTYFSDHANLVFSHGICPQCYEKHWGAELAGSAGKKK